MKRYTSDKVDRAVACLHEALGQFPDYLGIYWALGQALMNQRKVDETIAIYDKGLERNPADSALLCAKGIALKATGKLEDTIRHYRHAIGLQPQVPELHHNLALVFQQQGNTEALQQYEALGFERVRPMYLMRCLREQHPGIPIVVMSGYATGETVKEAEALGAAFFLPKPFTPDELAGTLRSVTKKTFKA